LGGGAEAAQAAQAAARDVAGQITLAVTQAAQPQVELRLDPPELGRVQIRLNPTEGVDCRRWCSRTGPRRRTSCAATPRRSCAT
jgi:hypothetical protein